GRGALPTLIAWTGPLHPAASLPDSGVALQRLALGALPAQLRTLLRTRLPEHIECLESDAAPALLATLATSRGRIELRGDVASSDDEKGIAC
ncbi:MAG: hypothetical protein ABIO45_15250, partial [Burkholderiaceae bacterium]